VIKTIKPSTINDHPNSLKLKKTILQEHRRKIKIKYNMRAIFAGGELLFCQKQNPVNPSNVKRRLQIIGNTQLGGVSAGFFNELYQDSSK
jgi:hypothetical protein